MDEIETEDLNEAFRNWTGRPLEIAEDHRRAMQGMSEHDALSYAHEQIENAPITVGVYPDQNEPDGVGLHLIKGRRELHALLANGGEQEYRVAAIPCVSLGQAVAAEHVLGDGGPSKLQ